MQIKDLLKDTTAMVCGRIDSKENNVEKMLNMMEYNKPVLESCHSIVLVLNRGADEKEITEIKDGYKQTFKNVYLLQPQPVGMGHQIGHITLDKTGYLFAKNNLGSKYTMKMCNDILVSNRFLELEIEDADFYYLPSVGMNEMVGSWNDMLNEFKIKKGYKNVFLNCQTWFFIAANNTDVLYESDEEIENIFRKWDHINDVKQARLVCAEHSLIKWAINNDLKRHSLYSTSQFEKYKDTVITNQIYDGSLKNVFLEPIGIVHYHFSKQQIAQFNL
jgi:hypothetical protein